MRGTMLRVLLGAGIAGVLVVSSATASFAALDTSRVSKTIVGVGSDTTYEAMMALDQAYDESAGCAVIPPNGTSFTTFKETCISDGQFAYGGDLIDTENTYHDRAIEAYPVGSGNGKTILTQFVQNGAGTALASDYSRASSKQTFTAPSGTTAFGVAWAREGLGYWVGKGNTHVAHSGKGATATPKPNVTIADLANTFIGNNTGKCYNTWATSASASIKRTFATPSTSAGNIRPFATQVGSGTGKDFANKITLGVNNYADASALQNCIPNQWKDGDKTNGEHVIFENNATPICNQQGATASFKTTAIYPYSFGRYTQNKGGTGSCPGVLGAVNGIKPTVATDGDTTSSGYPLGRYVYNYFILPNSVDVTDPTSWGQYSAVLDYLDPINGWLCKPTGHSANPNTGVVYGTEIKNIMAANGFSRLPSSAVLGSTWSGNSDCRDASAT